MVAAVQCWQYRKWVAVWKAWLMWQLLAVARQWWLWWQWLAIRKWWQLWQVLEAVWQRWKLRQWLAIRKWWPLWQLLAVVRQWWHWKQWLAIGNWLQLWQFLALGTQRWQFREWLAIRRWIDKYQVSVLSFLDYVLSRLLIHTFDSGSLFVSDSDILCPYVWLTCQTEDLQASRVFFCHFFTTCLCSGVYSNVRRGQALWFEQWIALSECLFKLLDYGFTSITCMSLFIWNDNSKYY